MPESVVFRGREIEGKLLTKEVNWQEMVCIYP